MSEWPDFCRRVPTNFSFEGVDYVDAFPIQVQVDFGVTWGFFSVENNAQWRPFPDSWEHASYNTVRVRIRLMDSKKLSTNDLRGEAALIPATFTIEGMTFRNALPTKVEQGPGDTITGIWDKLPIVPPPLYGWWPYAYKMMGATAVEIKCNFQHAPDRPGYSTEMILAQAREITYVLMPRDASVWRGTMSELTPENSVATPVAWALKELGGKYSAGFIISTTNGKPPSGLPTDSADEVLKGFQDLGKGGSSVLSGVGGFGRFVGSIGSEIGRAHV